MPTTDHHLTGLSILLSILVLTTHLAAAAGCQRLCQAELAQLLIFLRPAGMARAHAPDRHPAGPKAHIASDVISTLPWLVQAKLGRSCMQSKHNGMRCRGNCARHACARQTASRAPGT